MACTERRAQYDGRMFIDLPEVRPGDDIDVSATTFVAFLQCPERAAARLRGEYGPDSRAAFKGGLSRSINSCSRTRANNSCEIGSHTINELCCRIFSILGSVV